VIAHEPPWTVQASETSPRHAATWAGLLPDVRDAGTGEARPRNLRLAAMLWQSNVFTTLAILLLNSSKFRLQFLQTGH